MASNERSTEADQCGSGLQQASAGCGLQLHDTSDATCQCSSVCGTPETPKERESRSQSSFPANW